jgi:deoxycytidylate deaminase
MKLNFCPNCGERITISFTCPNCGKINDKYLSKCVHCGKEVDIKSICPKCNIEIFEEYLPGSTKSPGKLLDMCRALHAEENALLNLPKNILSSGVNLVLYTTTQPCNLCSNKIGNRSVTLLDEAIFF